MQIGNGEWRAISTSAGMMLSSNFLILVPPCLDFLFCQGLIGLSLVLYSLSLVF